MQPIAAYFRAALEAKASDIHLVAGEKPIIRKEGVLQELESSVLPEKELKDGIYGLLTPEQKKTYEDELELDISTEVEGGRFRLNIHQQDGKIGLAGRAIPINIPTPDALNLEATVRELVNLKDGLVLLVGPTGSGKSTVIASLIEEINKTKKSHIITIEDPIEFVFQNKQSLVEQREVGIDTKSFAAALKHVLRQDPNVILVGEMRDPETIAIALTAAETGHLVFSTLHTNNAPEAIERIVDVFDGAKQRQILTQLAAVLRVVVAQQLLPGVDGMLVAAREILVNTPAVGNIIRENNIAQLKSIIQTGVKDGMQTMEMSIKKLVDEGKLQKK